MSPAEKAWEEYNSKLKDPWLEDGPAPEIFRSGYAAGRRDALDEALACEPTSTDVRAIWRRRIAALRENQ